MLQKISNELIEGEHIDCFVMILKIMRRVLDFNMVTQNEVRLMIRCLTAMSNNINRLSPQDKETFYHQVKKLARTVIQKHKAKYQQLYGKDTEATFKFE